MALPAAQDLMDTRSESGCPESFRLFFSLSNRRRRQQRRISTVRARSSGNIDGSVKGVGHWAFDSVCVSRLYSRRRLVENRLPNVRGGLGSGALRRDLRAESGLNRN